MRSEIFASIKNNRKEYYQQLRKQKSPVQEIKVEKKSNNSKDEKAKYIKPDKPAVNKFQNRMKNSKPR